MVHVTQCPYCLRGHTKTALRAGAQPEELMEAIWVAAEMRAGGAYAHSIIALAAAAPDGVTAMRGSESHVRGSGLETSLIELVKVRASQVNGCAYCLDMHTKDARAAGEKEQRLYTDRRVARCTVFQRARAGGAGLDRGGDSRR